MSLTRKTSYNPHFLTGLLLSVTAVVLLGCAPTSSPQIAEGKAVYTEQCARCHGVEGEGQPDWQQPTNDGTFPAPPHNDTGHTWHHPDAQLLMVIQEGRNGMPAFKDSLTVAQQEAVLAYIKTFWSSDNRTVQEDVTRQWNDQFNQ